MNNIKHENSICKKDYFGKDISILKEKKLFLFDMDGTIYEEDKVFEGTVDLLNKIKEIGGKYVFITNNSSKSINDYIEKINSMGIYANEHNFSTSTQATIKYIKSNFRNKVVYCMGTNSLINELRENGIKVVTEVKDEVDLVLVGFDTELNFLKLRNTCELLSKDIPYIATNPDYACPVNFGFVPDCGAICNMIYHATSKNPIFIGKPQPFMVNDAIEKFKVNKEETVVIGDRLYTDIAIGINAGVTTVCVLTGEAKVEDIIESEIKPTFTLESVVNILNCIQ